MQADDEPLVGPINGAAGERLLRQQTAALVTRAIERFHVSGYVAEKLLTTVDALPVRKLERLRDGLARLLAERQHAAGRAALERLWAK